MIKFVYGCLPAIVIYNDSLVPEKFGGITWVFFILLREKYKTDQGILEHELVHVRQLYRTLFLSPLIYLRSKKYRLKCEVEAYRKQLSYYPDKADSLRWMSNAISTKYKLNITAAEAYRKLVEDK